MLLLVVLLAIHLEASKIAYKKPLYGKSNYIKEKKLRSKGLKPESTTTATTTTEEDWPSAVEFVIVTTTPRSELEISSEASYNGSSSTIESVLETATTMSVETSTRPGDVSSKKVESTTIPMSTTTSSTLVNTLPSPPTPGAAVAPPPIPDNQPVPCTCGVFLSSQIPNGLPTAPLINQELDRMFPCNAIGRKQCQTKCLEAVSTTINLIFIIFLNIIINYRSFSTCRTPQILFAPLWATIATRSAPTCSSKTVTTNGLIPICRRAGSTAVAAGFPTAVP